MTLKIYSTLLISIIFSSVVAQPYQVGHITATFIDITRNNRQVETEIYYPATVSGDSAAFATGAGKTPVVIFAHGFLMTWSAYENCLECAGS